MSWTPTFWIKAKDFEELARRDAKALSRLLGSNDASAHEFSLAGSRGVVIYASSEISEPNRKLHTLFEKRTIEHWIVDGESAECGLCRCWGRTSLDEYDVIRIKDGGKL